jgi:NADPH-dependent 2,4-dienoyl-CoA reductase/sulfur reductase-like enzyme
MAEVSRLLEPVVNANLGGDAPAAAPEARRVVVAGGGPAGMEVARVATARGHHVTLVETQPFLGGQLHLCARPAFKDEIRQLTGFLTAELKRLEVDVRLSTPLTAELIDELRPEVVVVATGSCPAPLPVPGGDAAHVVTAWDALAGTARVGNDVVVVGGGAVGVETALFLAQENRRMTVVEMLNRIAEDESPTMRPFLERQLAHHEVTILTEHTVLEVRPGSVVVTAEGSITRHELRCDTVVSAVGTRRNAVLIDELTDRGIRFLTVGDCAEDSTGTIAGAIHGGFNAALQI